MKKFIKSFLILLIAFIGINGVSAETITTVQCGAIDNIPAALPQFIKNIINIVKIAAPIILVIMGMLDFAKSVVSSDEKSMKESQNKFIKRVIAAVVIFLVVTIVQLIFRVINTDDTNEMASCIDCFINGDCSGSNESNEELLAACKTEASATCREQCSPSEGLTGDPEIDSLLGTGGSTTEYNRCAANCEVQKHEECKIKYGINN